MGPLRWIWIAAPALAAAAAAGAILVARSGDSTDVAPQASLSVRASLDRSTVEFGDPVTATVTVLVDRPAEVKVHENLAPLTPLSRTRVTSATRGRLRAVTYTTRLGCLDQRCISARGSKRVALRPVRVQIAGRAQSRAAWPVLEVRSRVTQADLQRLRPPLRSDTSPPPVTYRIEPARLARALEVAAAVLAAGGVLLAGWTAATLYRSRRRAAPLSPLEHALALAREAERRPAPDRRRALGLLARLLGSRDPQLASSADELAWSAPAPSRDAVAALVNRVEREANGA